MEEETPPIQPIEFPLSDLTEEMAQSFQGLAKAQGKRLTLSIPPMLSYTGDEKAIRQLLSILLDNALKYTPEEGEVEIALKKEGRMIRLSVSNTIAHPMERETLGRLFDRFTGAISPVAVRPAVTAWVCPLPRASCWPTGEKSGQRAAERPCR